MMCSLYNGTVQIWNFETQNVAKSFEVADVPGMRFAHYYACIVQSSSSLRTRRAYSRCAGSGTDEMAMPLPVCVVGSQSLRAQRMQS